MKVLNSFFKIGVVSNLVVFLAMMLLPAFIITDQLDVFERIIFYIFKK
ncbi:MULTISPECIES: hypothetical protein [Peribacillus]|uniref:Uncharacterized protein n=1 Tax=Peribacillus asahii TaxID=228899 RepID=A0A3T0KNI2_9BACI|nr:hypothetical protein [Peribacillus asahii]AZV41834.1 hypothetical protein BAOM_1224 [Peribacillus asahii]USK86207.1 hypothetical protein LIT35_06085 [Peribacillus asahii]